MLTEKGKFILKVTAGVILGHAIFGPVGAACVLLIAAISVAKNMNP